MLAAHTHHHHHTYIYIYIIDGIFSPVRPHVNLPIVDGMGTLYVAMAIYMVLGCATPRVRLSRVNSRERGICQAHERPRAQMRIAKKHEEQKAIERQTTR